MDTKVDSAESRLNAKIDGVDTKVDGVETRLTAKIDGVDTKVDGVESRLTAKVDGVDTKVDRVETKMDGVKTELKADIAVQGAELKAITRELSFYRWLFIILVALLALLAAIGLLPKIEQWLGWDSTPTQSVQTPVDANPTETVVPPEADSPELSPE